MVSWRAPSRVELPWIRPDVDSALRVPVAPVSRAARLLTVVIASVLVLVGAGLAVGADVLAEREDTEAIGSLGLELGAAMWFAGVLTFFFSSTAGSRRSVRPTAVP